MVADSEAVDSEAVNLEAVDSAVGLVVATVLEQTQ